MLDNYYYSLLNFLLSSAFTRPPIEEPSLEWLSQSSFCSEFGTPTGRAGTSRVNRIIDSSFSAEDNDGWDPEKNG